MRLAAVQVGPFKSINAPQTVELDPSITVLVGMNEAGKTVFLQALEKSGDVLEVAKFDPVEDYPRRLLPTYLKKHASDPETVTVLTYELSDAEIKTLNDTLHTKIKSAFRVSTNHSYDNKSTVSISIDEAPALEHLLKTSQLSSDAVKAAKKASSIRGIADALKDVDLTETDQTFIEILEQRTTKPSNGWTSVTEWEAWQWISPRIPRFLYFGDYDLLPSKTNLAELAQRVVNSKNDPKQLAPEHRGVLALLRMADISIEDFSKPGGYEPLRAKIEGVSISLTDQIMEFWKQNEDLEVVVDIQTDLADTPPFNNGPNLYLRIANRRHRGVTTPFRQRSRGFIWFFSFLVWFDSVQYQLIESKQANRPLVLLLDEPGLSLHALAQSDFLRYIEDLAKRHQVIYTTHSPFMVDHMFLSLIRSGGQVNYAV